MGLSDYSLTGHYKLVYQMAHKYKYSIADLENMYPFEFDLFIEMILAEIEQKKREAQSG